MCILVTSKMKLNNNILPGIKHKAVYLNPELFSVVVLNEETYKNKKYQTKKKHTLY